MTVDVDIVADKSMCGNTGRSGHPQAKSAPPEGDKEAALFIKKKSSAATATPIVPFWFSSK